MTGNYTQNFLVGGNAFYNRPNFIQETKNNLARDEAGNVAYKRDTEHKIIRIAKYVFSIIIFPVGIYNVIHAIVGKFVLPASFTSLADVTNNRMETDLEIKFSGGWVYKRIALEFDGYKIDAMIMGKPATLNNGKWVLGSNGNGEFYEDKISGPSDFKRIVSNLEGNAILFNYPGVGASTGMPSRQAMEKAYQTMLHFLEDQNDGIGAKQIIGYAHSIGGASQGDALRSHELKKNIKYVFVNSRTFSDLETTISTIFCSPMGFLAKVFGWNMDSVQSSKNLKAAEIILQSASVNDCEELQDSSKIINDGVIYKEASLGKVLLDDPETPRKNKVFIGVPELHNDQLSFKSRDFIVERINELLKTA